MFPHVCVYTYIDVVRSGIVRAIPERRRSAHPEPYFDTFAPHRQAISPHYADGKYLSLARKKRAITAAFKGPQSDLVEIRGVEAGENPKLTNGRGGMDFFLFRGKVGGSTF